MIRFDDLIIGTLSNMYRYNHLYWESLIEFVKRGKIIPVLDGFEEMFVESDNKEDTYSSLGFLLSQLQSKGSILIASRIAYFDYTDFTKIAKIADTLRFQYSNTKIQISKWNKDNFIEYLSKREIEKSETVYYEILDIVKDEKHSVLTRPFLVKKMVSLLKMNHGLNVHDLLRHHSSMPDEFLIEFVEEAIKREQTKWINSSDPNKTIIKYEQHIALLSLIAQELWINNTETIRLDEIHLLIEIFIEIEDFNDMKVKQQLNERMLTHVLLLKNQNEFYFEHDEFRNIFLSNNLFHLIQNKDTLAIKSLLRKKIIPESCPRYTAIFLLKKKHLLFNNFIYLKNLIQDEDTYSLFNENVGSIISLLISNYNPDSKLELSSSFIKLTNFSTIVTKNYCFENCRFIIADFKNHKLQDCCFKNCKFEKLCLNNYDESIYKNIEFNNCTITQLETRDGHHLFDPEEKESLVHRLFGLKREEESSTIYEIDENLKFTSKLINYFLRKNTISIGVLRMKFGKNANYLEKELLPELVNNDIIEELSPNTKGSSFVYRLKISFEKYSSKYQKSKGNFDLFLHS